MRGAQLAAVGLGQHRDEGSVSLNESAARCARDILADRPVRPALERPAPAPAEQLVDAAPFETDSPVLRAAVRWCGVAGGLGLVGVAVVAVARPERGYEYALPLLAPLVGGVVILLAGGVLSGLVRGQLRHRAGVGAGRHSR